MSDYSQDEIKRFIRSAAVNKTINPEKQNRHILNSASYINGRSYLLDGVDAQALVDKYHCTGYVPLNHEGKWKNKETVSLDHWIAVNVNPVTGEQSLTNRFTIHYSRTGTHIVPSERSLNHEAMGI